MNLKPGITMKQKNSYFSSNVLPEKPNEAVYIIFSSIDIAADKPGIPAVTTNLFNRLSAFCFAKS